MTTGKTSSLLTRSAAFAFAVLTAAAQQPAAQPQAQQQKDSREAQFEELCSRVQRGKGEITENDVATMLATARQLGYPFAAEAAFKSYNALHPNLPPRLMLMAADNAVMAGDYRAAAARYKSYLHMAVPGKESSDAAALLYDTLINFLGMPDDAYEFMKTDGDKFRQSDAARKFDTWFLDTARAKGDVVACAKRLVQVLAEKMPVEKEKYFYWDYIDWIMQTARVPGNNLFDALPNVRQLIGALRAEPERMLKYKFYLANLEFKAATVGKSGEDAAKSFEPVAAAAKAWFDASPTKETLIDIQYVFSANFQAAEWQIAQSTKREFFVQAFAKLPDDQKAALVPWMKANAASVASPEQWSAMASAHPGAFALAGEFLSLKDAPDLYAKQAQFLADSRSPYAAVAKSLAAGRDLETCARHLVEKESWFLNAEDVYSLLSGQIWPAIKAASGDQMTPDQYDAFMAKFGAETLAASPAVLLDPKISAAFIMAAWKGDKSKLTALLHSLDWVPFSDKERQEIFEPPYKAFLAWANEARTAATALSGARAKVAAYEQIDAKRKAAAEAKAKAEEAAKQAAASGDKAAADKAAQDAQAAASAWAAADAEAAKAAGAAADAKAMLDKFQGVDEKVAESIGPIETAFKEVMAPSVFNADKAPNPLCKALALAAAAARDGKAEDYVKFAREAYAQVKDSQSARKPFGAAVLAFLAKYRPDLDVLDFQLEILADQLALWQAGGPDSGVKAIYNAIISGRAGWPNQTPASDQEAVRRLGDVLEKALFADLEKGKLSGMLFDWFRASRAGNGWQHGDAGVVLMGRMIENKTLLNSGYRVGGGWTAAATYMWLVRHEFLKLKDQYPAESYFDDMYVGECAKSNKLDFAYWAIGSDNKGKVTSLACKLLQGYTALPLSYQTFLPDKELWKWHSQCLLRDAAWRKDHSVDEAERTRLIAMLEAAFGNTRFDDFALGASYFEADASGSDDGRRQFFDRLAAYSTRAMTLPARVPPPSFKAIEKVEGLSDAELTAIVNLFPDLAPFKWFTGRFYEALPALMHRELRARKRYADLVALIPQFWRIARDTGNTALLRKLGDFATDAQSAGLTDVAAKYATAGLDLGGAAIPDDLRVALTGIKMRGTMGAIIPVDRGDPRYPIFAAQAAYMAGNYQNALELYGSAAERVAGMFKELDPMFVLWLISRQTEIGEYARAENLARNMMQWIDSLPEGYDREVRGQLLLAYADIPFKRQEYARAKALLDRIVASSVFDGTKAKNDAELKLADLDRCTRNYDSAITRLEKLMQKRDRYIQTEAGYTLALVKFDKEEFKEAKEILNRVFALEPNHQAGRILEGKVNLELKKYEKATDLDVGSPAEQKIVVPGKPLKVRLDDKALAVAGGAASVEMRAWTDSGDEEHFNLLPDGESRTTFAGQINTMLGPPNKGDHFLQLLGSDKVYYDYSENFKRANNVKSSEPTVKTVASDSTLYVSSGRIISENEEEQFLLEQLVRSGDRSTTALELIRSRTSVKPGNVIRVRVEDQDASTTAAKDKVAIKIACHSGDSISSFLIEETDTHSGIFEGEVPTAPAGAMAFATDSDEGKLPAYAIMARADFPPWVALPNNIRPKIFNIDMNDNVALGLMRIEADMPGRLLKSFFVQTSLNSKDYETLGSWPQPYEPWNGTPGFLFVDYLDSVQPRTADAIRNYIEAESVGRGAKRVFVPMTNLFASAGSTVMAINEKKIPISWAKNAFAGRFRAAFWLPNRKSRAFRLEVRGVTGQALYFFAVDGVLAATEQTTPPVFSIKRQFSKGPHYIDIYCYGARQSQSQIELMCDSDEPPYFVPCSAKMLDPAFVPELTNAVRQAVATISANTNATAFDVQFPTNAHARAIRLVLSDFETDAPSIRKISLTDASGKVVLPTTNDILAAGKNQILELVSGDKITISYEDPKVVTKGKEVQERIMTAQFNDADIKAVVIIDPTNMSRSDNLQPLYRFGTGEKIDVAIFDPDCDTSNVRDTITFTAKPQFGKPITLKALETESHSGVFLGAVFPVKTEPSRANELKVEPEEDIEFAYYDAENTSPGVPVWRKCSVPQVAQTPPELRVYDVESKPIPPEKLASMSNEIARLRESQLRDALQRKQEFVSPSRELIAKRPVKADNSQPAQAIRGGPILVELIYPAAARSGLSEESVFIQTGADRRRAGVDTNAPFTPDVPGTTNITTGIGDFKNVAPPPGYLSVLVQGNPYASSPELDGRFSFTISSVDDNNAWLGYRFIDASGATNWISQKVNLYSDAFFDVMDRFYSRDMAEIHVGENAYLRINNRSMDTSDEKDSVQVSVSSTSGTATNLVLTETFEHTGQFKGVLKTSFAGDTNAALDPGTLPVNYGDTISISYKPERGEPITRTVKVAKGADGNVVSFSKSFKDPEIAVRTQFTIAEAYFEMAKKHRALEQESLARREIAQGRKLLEEAIKDYPDIENRVQADYLLADLDLEFANDAQNDAIKRQKYLEAINRFNEIIMAYPDSLYAPKAQYKKALAYEKMGDIDQACEEYVKLSYMYPDSDLIAETIARLGNYFASKGKDLEAKANEQTEEKEKEKYKKMAFAMFKTAGEVFSRLAPRFPTHQLAGKTMVISGTCFIRAEEYQKGLDILAQAISTVKDDPELSAEAMYWRGDTYMKTKDLVNAYRQFKQLTWDYPASKWAKYARGRLTDPGFRKIIMDDSTMEYR